MIDYEVLRFIWWLLVGILLIGFAVTDGFDMGVGMLTRFLGRNDTDGLRGCVLRILCGDDPGAGVVVLPSGRF